MRRIIFSIIFCTLCIFGFSSQAQAMLSAILTADNHYALYYGAVNGSGLTFVGRNEIGSAGSPGTFNWSLPETWNFNPNSNDFLYVLAWDADFQQMWIGDFTLPDGSSLLSNTTDWEFYISANSNPGDLGNPPILSTIAAEIASAVWAAPLASAPQGTSPWGNIPGISASAKFIWDDTLLSSSDSDAHYVIFRTKNSVNPVPEPMTLTLLATGMAGVVACRRVRK